MIVEGIGGFKVPLNEKQDSADLAQQLELPVLLVVGLRLGCLNHALLTTRCNRIIRTAFGRLGRKCVG